MFFKEIHLTKNHWSVKVLDWAFPSLPTFYNFCPHFWMTILALILSPFIGFGKLVVFLAIKSWKGFCFVADKLRAVFDAYNERMVDKILNQNLLSNDELRGLAAYRNDITFHANEINTKKLANKYNIEFCRLKKIAKYYEVLVKTTSGRAKLNTIYYSECGRDHYNDFMTLLKSVSPTPDNLRKVTPAPVYKPEPVKLQNRPWWPKAILLAKILLTPIVLILAAAALYGVYFLFLIIGWVFYWIGHGIASVNWANVCLGFLVCAIIIGVIVGIALLVAKLIMWIRTLNFSMPRCIICRAIGKAFGFVFGTIFGGALKIMGSGLVSLFEGIGSICSFFWIVITSWKKDNCPAIIWEDDND